jgi:hydroxyquinol 1,2-dioxygenase
MDDFTADTLTAAVLAELKAPDPRLQEIVTSVIAHLHAFVREVEPTEAEWWAGIDFLTRTGQKCDDNRQEFILLSDTLGITALVDAVNHDAPGATASTVTGPFYRPSPVLENGAIIARGAEWNRGGWTRVHGQVADSAGQPLAGARLEVWQSDDAGMYDSQDDRQPAVNLRGTFIADQQGRYWFRTVKPSSYPVPVDGPVGELLTATGRHPMRPAHIHFKVTAPGYRSLTTHLFVAGDPYLASDAVFAVKGSLVADFVLNDIPEAAAQHGLPGPFHDVEFNIRLASI